MSNEVKKSSAEVLAEVLLRRETAEIAVQEEKKARHAVRVAGQQKLDADIISNEQRLQCRCTHRKKADKSFFRVDYNVIQHTFANGKGMIMCASCKMMWNQGDTRELRYVEGAALPNHTGISYEDALKFTEQTTNKPSTAERFGQFTAQTN